MQAGQKFGFPTVEVQPANGASVQVLLAGGAGLFLSHLHALGFVLGIVPARRVPLVHAAVHLLLDEAYEVTGSPLRIFSHLHLAPFSPPDHPFFVVRPRFHWPKPDARAVTQFPVDVIFLRRSGATLK